MVLYIIFSLTWLRQLVLYLATREVAIFRLFVLMPIPWVEQLKYLGVVFNAHGALTVDVASIKRKCYAAVNSVLAKCSCIAEPVKVQLIESFCLPLLTYCVGALELSSGAVNELSVCWNDAFRKIFHFNRWESAKQLHYYSGCLDFMHLYDLARYRFLSTIRRKLPYLDRLRFVLVLNCIIMSSLSFVIFTSGQADYPLWLLCMTILSVVRWACES